MTQQVLSSAGAIKESNSFGNAGYGTSLPASPTDGMEYILVDSVTLPTYQWRLRYNTGSSNTDKWEFVGGIPAGVEITTGEATSSSSYADLATAGPSFTVPRAGRYMIAFGADINQGTAGGKMAVKLGAAATADNEMVIAALFNFRGTVARTLPSRTLAASDVLKCQYLNTSSASTTFTGRFLTVTPIRVS